MSFCIKSTQVWVFPERRDTEKLFPLTCRGGGEREAKEELSGVMRMSCFYVYLLRLSSKIFIINPSSSLIASLSYTLNGHPGPCPDKELFCPVLENIQMFPSNIS